MTREEAIKILEEIIDEGWLISDFEKCTAIDACEMAIKALEQEPQIFKWCETCKEYDQEKHCCHRWSKVIRDTVKEMKQGYIEREVLDKIREQMKDYLRGVEITLEVLVENDPLRPKMEGAKDTLEECLELIDRAESEDKE